MSANIVTWYWIIALMMFTHWLMLFYQDRSTPNNDFISWAFLLITPLFWPIVLPIATWELSHKVLKNNSILDFRLSTMYFWHK